VYMTLGLLAF